MRLYHTTAHADAIEREGFRDGSGDLLALDIPEETVAPFEWPNDECVEYDWRGFLVPAAIVNQYPARRLGVE